MEKYEVKVEAKPNEDPEKFMERVRKTLEGLSKDAVVLAIKIIDRIVVAVVTTSRNFYTAAGRIKDNLGFGYSPEIAPVT